MSARNGDKARYHRERQSADLRQKRRAELRKALGLDNKSPVPANVAPTGGKS